MSPPWSLSDVQCITTFQLASVTECMPYCALKHLSIFMWQYHPVTQNIPACMATVHDPGILCKHLLTWLCIMVSPWTSSMCCGSSWMMFPWCAWCRCHATMDILMTSLGNLTAVSGGQHDDREQTVYIWTCSTLQHSKLHVQYKTHQLYCSWSMASVIATLVRGYHHSRI